MRTANATGEGFATLCICDSHPKNLCRHCVQGKGWSEGSILRRQRAVAEDGNPVSEKVDEGGVRVPEGEGREKIGGPENEYMTVPGVGTYSVHHVLETPPWDSTHCDLKACQIPYIIKIHVSYTPSTLPNIYQI